jgi:hypothetical protein
MLTFWRGLRETEWQGPIDCQLPNHIEDFLVHSGEAASTTFIIMRC